MPKKAKKPQDEVEVMPEEVETEEGFSADDMEDDSEDSFGDEE